MRAIFLISLFSAIFSIISHNIFIFLAFETALFVPFLLRTSKVLRKSNTDLVDYPFVSIIVPMRNEENNVIECVRSLMSLDYPNFEVIIGDDSSTDNTKKILAEEINKNQIAFSIKLFDISQVPNGWMGRTWATYQLIKEAKGELMLVTDADVRHSSKSLKSSISHFLETKADIMVRFLSPIIKGVGEWPILFLIFILKFSSWFSLRLLGRQQAIARGEYLIFSKHCYERLGEYKAFKNNHPITPAIFNFAFKKGMNVVIVDDDSQEIETRMYEGFTETAKGILGRTNFHSFGFYSFLGAFLPIFFAVDYIFKIISGILTNDNLLIWGGLASYSVFVLFFAVHLAVSRQSFYIAVFAPFLAFYFVLIGLLSIIRSAFNRPLRWKGRVYQIQ